MALDDFIFFTEVIDNSDSDYDSENEYNDDHGSDESDSCSNSYSSGTYRSTSTSGSVKPAVSDEQKPKSPLIPAAPKHGNGCMWTSLACIATLFVLIGVMVNVYEGFCRDHDDSAQDSVECETKYTEPESHPNTYDGYGYEEELPTDPTHYPSYYSSSQADDDYYYEDDDEYEQDEYEYEDDDYDGDW